MELKKEREIASVEEIEEALTKVLTKDFYKKLMAYTIKRFKVKFGIKYDTVHGYKGLMVEDIISNLMLSFLDKGGRSWYKDSFPQFESQIFSALDSEVYNLVKRVYAISEKVDVEETPIIDFHNQEFVEIQNFCTDFLINKGADADELLVFDCLSKGILVRSEIAKELKIPPESVTYIRKRLNKKILLLRQELS